MKKYLIPLFMLVSLPVFSMCSIDSGESVCALPSFREQVQPIFKESLGNTNLSNPNYKLQPLNRPDPMDKMRGPNNTLNYDSSCQFGVCLQNPNESVLPSEN